MSVRRPVLAAAGAALLGAFAGCFTGVGTLGAVCYDDNQCGIDQGCVNSVCGQCGNLRIDEGELCFGNSSEENVFGEVTDLIAYDPEDDGEVPLIMATVNTNCAPPGPQAGPPEPGEPGCWQLLGLVNEGGDFEATDLLADLDVEGDFEIGDGRVPQVATGNFDGEDTMDVAMAVFPNDPNVDPSQLFVAHNLGLSDNKTYTFRDISSAPTSIHAADLNGDGLDDLVIGGQVSSSPELLFSSPGLAFDSQPLVVVDPENTCPRFAPPADMDNDGDLDVPLVANGSGVVGVYLNNGDGLLSSAGGITIAEDLICPDQDQLDNPVQQSGSLNLATADFDLDGNEDVVVFLARFGESEIRLYRGLGDGTLELDTTLPGGELPVSGLATDVNFDGLPDIVVADLGEDVLPVFLNRRGEFPDAVGIDVATTARTLMYADADRDGVGDIVVGYDNGVVAVVPSEN